MAVAADEVRHLGPALVLRQPAPRMERTADGQIGRIGRRARDGGQPMRARAVVALVDPWHRFEQVRGVGVFLVGEQRRGWSTLDHSPAVHDHHVVTCLRDDAHIVGDHQHGDAELVFQPREQPQDLRLDGHVQGGGRLVGDQQLRGAGQRDRDHHPLAHPAGELVRVLADAPFGVRDSYLSK
jgi:hypothetical protein